MNNIKAIAFDFGNTLCPWDEEQYWAVTRIALTHMCERMPGTDMDAVLEVFSKVRNEDSAINLPQSLENDLPGIYQKTAAEVCGKPLSSADLSNLVDTHIKAFVGVCHPPKGLKEFLTRLSSKYRLALLSNYPLPDAIRLSLIEFGVDKLLDPVIVSGDVGIIKPHRMIFDKLLADLDLPAEQVLFVGDDWVADIMGASASGMPSIQIANHHGKGKLEGVFGHYIRQAVYRPEFSPWREAKPLAVLNSVLDLEGWLDKA